MPGPLAGYRIIDLTQMVSGPLATMILADQGADVIKVEPPEGGDHTRAAAQKRSGFSAMFLSNNRNKRSLVLDLKRREGLEVLLRLAKGADVFVQNFRPGVVERLGVGEEAIRRVSSAIVYVSLSGYGESGPFAGNPAYDPLIQAMSGLATIQAGSDEARPRLLRTILPDKLTAISAAQAIAAALAAREKSGEGQHVRLSMLDAVLAFLWSSDMESQTFVEGDLPLQRRASFIDLIYETAQGHVSVAVQTDREWAALAHAVERPQWLSDPRFKTPALRQKNVNLRLEMTQEVLRTAPATFWLERLTRAGVPCAPVLKRNEVIRHPQVAASESLVECEHPLAGRLRQARPAARFSRTPAEIRRPAPALGEQSREILGEIGFSESEIARFFELGVTKPRPGTNE
jgi:crotonobetainyl-CoA:carnitine CoA-transferase CaiB-like acyl-CoA transferase